MLPFFFENQSKFNIKQKYNWIINTRNENYKVRVQNISSAFEKHNQHESTKDIDQLKYILIDEQA